MLLLLLCMQPVELLHVGYQIYQYHTVLLPVTFPAGCCNDSITLGWNDSRSLDFAIPPNYFIDPRVTSSPAPGEPPLYCGLRRLIPSQKRRGIRWRYVVLGLSVIS